MSCRSDKLRIEFAPMEGITGYPFRFAFRDRFGGIDRFYTPFLSVSQSLGFGRHERRELDTGEDDKNMVPTVPQLLVKRGEELAWGIEELIRLNRRDVNINLGCPSPTVYKRGRGSGMLIDPPAIDRMLDGAFEILESHGIGPDDFNLSVKMRIGMYDTSKLHETAEIINRYPVSYVIVHPRLGIQGYSGKPDLNAYGMALEYLNIPVLYNGDIRSVEDHDMIMNRFPDTAGLMIGRGLLEDPFLAEKIESHVSGIRWSDNDDISRLEFFTEKLYSNYLSYMNGNVRNALSRMKEYWSHLADGPYLTYDLVSSESSKGAWGSNRLLSNDMKRLLKKLKKAVTYEEYEVAVLGIFELMRGKKLPVSGIF